MQPSFDITHLRREARTALELAIAALAPEAILNPLAQCAGYLEALAEFPAATPAISGLLVKISEESRKALAEWARWKRDHVDPHTA